MQRGMGSGRGILRGGTFLPRQRAWRTAPSHASVSCCCCLVLEGAAARVQDDPRPCRGEVALLCAGSLGALEKSWEAAYPLCPPWWPERGPVVFIMGMRWYVLFSLAHVE